MSKGNPLCMKYYSYKVEFALRGAGHIHGVLWLDWKKFIVMGDRKKFVEEAFEKIRDDLSLSPENLKALSEFADHFITCSLRDPSTNSIVREVQIHHHTKTCRKYSTKCRFYFPRYPSLRTIISVPYNKLLLTKENQCIRLEEAKLILSKVARVLENEEVMKELGKLEMEKFTST